MKGRKCYFPTGKGFNITVFVVLLYVRNKTTAQANVTGSHEVCLHVPRDEYRGRSVMNTWKINRTKKNSFFLINL